LPPWVVTEISISRKHGMTQTTCTVLSRVNQPIAFNTPVGFK